jgi:xanthine dehydrogenase accessory factor
MAGSGESTLGVVVVAEGFPELVGKRVSWDGYSLRGDLGDSDLNHKIQELLENAGSVPGCHAIEGTGVEVYIECIKPLDELVIVGAGHIAQPLATIGRLLDFRVIVVDDRPEFASSERFPGADQVVVADFDDPFAQIPVGPRTYLVLVTRGHRYDFDCLRVLATSGAEPAYLGMIGSRRRVRATFEQLAQEGIDARWLEQVHAPIGLDIHAETPGEIAVAIAAEMIFEARGGSIRPLSEVKRVLRYVRSLK